jgi:hypothetical protein
MCVGDAAAVISHRAAAPPGVWGACSRPRARLAPRRCADGCGAGWGVGGSGGLGAGTAGAGKSASAKTSPGRARGRRPSWTLARRRDGAGRGGQAGYPRPGATPSAARPLAGAGAPRGEAAALRCGTARRALGLGFPRGRRAPLTPGRRGRPSVPPAAAWPRGKRLWRARGRGPAPAAPVGAAIRGQSRPSRDKGPPPGASTPWECAWGQRARRRRARGGRAATCGRRSAGARAGGGPRGRGGRRRDVFTRRGAAPPRARPAFAGPRRAAQRAPCAAWMPGGEMVESTNPRAAAAAEPAGGAAAPPRGAPRAWVPGGQAGPLPGGHPGIRRDARAISQPAAARGHSNSSTRHFATDPPASRASTATRRAPTPSRAPRPHGPAPRVMVDGHLVAPGGDISALHLWDVAKDAAW